MKSLIVDTDFETDCDDAGALAVLHALADQGIVEILGVNASIASPLPAAGVRALNTAFGRPGIPVGCNRSVPNGEVYRTLADAHHSRMYHAEMAERYPGAPAEDALAFYTRLLENAPDRSVTICAIGLLTSLAELLRSGGGDLIRRKVARLVTMAEAACPEGRDGFNWNMDRISAQTVLHNWPTEIVVSSLGGDVLTSAVSCGTTARAECLRIAYRRMGGGDETYRRSSWDQIAVLFAAGMFDDLSALSEPGTIRYNPADGGHRWTPGGGECRFLLPRGTAEAMAARIQQWMDRACGQNREFSI